MPGNIKGITIEIDGDTTKLTDALKKTNTETRSLQSELKQVEKGLKLDPHNTELVTQKQKILGDQVGLTRDKLKTLQDAQAQVNEQFKKGEIGEEQYRAFQRELIATTAEVARLEKGLIDAHNPFKELGTSMKETGDRVGEVGASLTKKVTLPLVAMGGLALKTGSEFSKAMKDIQSVTQYTGDQMKIIEDGIKSVSMATGTSLLDVGLASRKLVEAGGDIGLVMEQMKQGANLAIATNTDWGETFDFLSATMKTFGMDAEETQAVVDSLAATTTLTNISLSALGAAFVNVGGMASNVGLGINDINAMLIELSERGLAGGAAGTALNGVLKNLTTPTAAAAKELKNLNIELYDNEGMSRNMLDIMSELESAMSTMTDDQKARTKAIIFDSVSMKAWNNLADAGIDSIRELSGELAASSEAFDGQGRAAEMAALKQGGAAAQLQATVQVLATDISVVLAPIVATIAEHITNLVDRFLALDEGTQKTIIQILAVAAAVGPLLAIFGPLISIMGSVVTTIGALSAAMSLGATPVAALTMAFPKLAAAFTLITSPIGLIVIALAGLGIAIYKIVKNWDEIKAVTLETWDRIKEVVGEAIENVKTTISNKFQEVTAFFTEIWNNIKDIFSISGSDINEIVSMFLVNSKNLITDKWDEITGWLKGLWVTIKGQASEGWTGIQNAITEILDGIKTRFDNMIKDALSWGSNLIGNFISGIKSKLGDVADAARNVASTVGDYIRFQSPSRLGPGADADEWAPNLMKMFAEGMESNMGLLRNAASQAAKAMQPQGSITTQNYNSGGNTNNTNIYVQDTDDLLRELQRRGIRI